MKIGIISDVHSNFSALECTLRFLEDKIDALIIAGDIVGYGPQPAETLDYLLDFPINETYYTLGNHDLGVRLAYCELNGMDNCSEDFQILNSFETQPAAKAMFKSFSLRVPLLRLAS